MVTLDTEGFLDFSLHERAPREPRSGEHESQLIFAALQKKEKSRKTFGTRVMCGSYRVSLRPKTPSKSQKLRPKTPSESQKLRPKTPSESQKLRPKTPAESQKLRPRTPSEFQKLRPKTPSES